MTATVDKTVRTPTEYPHIERDYQGRPVIKGTRFRVAMVVRCAKGIERTSPEEIAEDHKSVINLAQVLEALDYYYQHKVEVDREIEEADRFAEEMRNRPEAIAAHERMIEKMKRYLADHPDKLLDNETANALRRSLA